MGGRRFRLQPLLEERRHREAARRAEFAEARRSHDAAAQLLRLLGARQQSGACDLHACALRGSVADARHYDAMLRHLDQACTRQNAQAGSTAAALERAEGALLSANRERRIVESFDRLRTDKLTALRYAREERDD
jgi:flagellar export protein FliJ